MHTVFSDGNVWPSVRVAEAWQEGLDVIAITDHMEYHPHADDIPVQFGRAYEIAKPSADQYGPGTDPGGRNYQADASRTF